MCLPAFIPLPEIAFVGIGEEKAKQQGIEYKIGSFNVAGNGRAMIMGEALGIAKLISDADGNLIRRTAHGSPRNGYD